MRQVLTIVSLLASALFGCTGENMPFVYKIDIPQGNIVSQEMVNQLERGMDKQRVIYVMGTPLLTDVFHQNRWDYVYSFKPGGGERTQRRISLYFENERLVRVEGDVKPASRLLKGVGTTSAQEPAPEDDTFMGDLRNQLGVETGDTSIPIPRGE